MVNYKQTDRAKYLSRRRRRTIELLFAFILTHSMNVLAQTEPSLDRQVETQTVQGNEIDRLPDTDAWPDILVEFLDRTDTFSADFEQELWSNDQQLIETATGTMQLSRPNRFRWHYDTPYEQLIVADGENLWMYDVEIAQVTRSAVVEADPSSPAMLLNGEASVRESFDITDVRENDGLAWVTLSPKIASSQFARVRMGFNSVNRHLAEIEFVDGLDQTTVIRFSNGITNETLDRSLFDFEAPDGVHVLGGGSG